MDYKTYVEDFDLVIEVPEDIFKSLTRYYFDSGRNFKTFLGNSTEKKYLESKLGVSLKDVDYYKIIPSHVNLNGTD